jgi:hypothetical protein
MFRPLRLTLCAAGLVVAAATADTALAENPATSPQRGQRELDVMVDARAPWQDSGLFVEAGQRLTIRASGTWRDRDGTTDVSGRSSQPLNGRRDEVALPGAPLMMLVG